MSTKIYNGFRIKNHTVDSFMGELKGLRDLALEQADVNFRNLAVRATVENIDNLCVFGEDGGKRDLTLYAVISDIAERQCKIKQTQQRDPAVDFGFDIVLMKHNNDLMGISYCEQASIRAVLERHPAYAEYAYWNNSEGPKHITEQKWDQRKRDWALVLEGYRLPPAQVGVTYTLVGNNHFDMPMDETKDLWLQSVPTLEQRAQNLAETYAFTLRNEPFVSMSQYNRLRQELASTGAVLAAYQELKQILVPAVDWEMLTTGQFTPMRRKAPSVRAGI